MSKRSLALLGMTREKGGATRYVFCHPEKRSDEGSLFGPERTRKGSLAALGITRNKVARTRYVLSVSPQTAALPLPLPSDGHLLAARACGAQGADDLLRDRRRHLDEREPFRDLDRADVARGDLRLVHDRADEIA